MMTVVVVEVGLGWSTMLEAGVVASGSSATAARFSVNVVEVEDVEGSDDGRGR